MAESWLESVVGNCRIEKKIGEGGCGQVFRGIDQILERPVALKVLHAKLAERSDTSERFISEAQALARLAHPNIATLYTFHKVHDTYVMVMEFVEGMTFEALLKRDGPMSPRVAIPLLTQALDGVGHVHRQGIVHRDLKATNLMLNDEGVVKVMDFGIAQIAGRECERGNDRPVGTPEYMSPEQVRGEELDPRSDLYSLGVLFYKLLSGRLPIRGDTPSEVMRAQLEASPRPLRDFVPNLPDTIVATVDRAMARNPADRYSSAAVFRQALVDAAETIEGLAGVVVSDPATLHALSPAVSESQDGDTHTIQASTRTPDTELGPTRVLWDHGEAPTQHVPKSPGRWRPAAALCAVAFLGISFFWLRPQRIVVAEERSEHARQSLTGLQPLPPLGFDTWPLPMRTGELARVPGLPLGPADFITVRVPEPDDADAKADREVEKARAKMAAKPQTRGAPQQAAKSSGKTKSGRVRGGIAATIPGAQEPDLQADADAKSAKDQEGWIIRR